MIRGVLVQDGKPVAFKTKSWTRRNEGG
jgi:hypothetical protein